MRKIILIVIIICGVTVQGQADTKYQQIDSLIQCNVIFDSMSALRKLKKDFAKDSNNSDYWLRHSKASFLAWGYQDASTSIDKAIKLNPKDSELYFEKGMLSNKGNELEIALQAFTKAIEIKKTGKYFFWRGIINSQLRRMDTAIKDYKEAIKNKFETPELFNNLAVVLMQEGRLKEALVNLNKVISINNDPGAYSERIRINFFLLNFDLGCKYLKENKKSGNRNNSQIPYSICDLSLKEQQQYIADLLLRYRLYKPAITTYTKLIKNKTTKSDDFFNRGYCYSQTKDYVNAEKDYLKALTLSNPELSMIYSNLSLLYFDIKNFDKSIEYATKLIALNPKNHLAYLDRGLAYRLLKKYPEAKKDFNKSLELKPDFFRAYGYRSFLYYEQGEYLKSLEDANKAIKLNPEYGYGYFVRSHAKKVLRIPSYCKDLKKAKKYSKKGLEGIEQAIKMYCR